MDVLSMLTIVSSLTGITLKDLARLKRKPTHNITGVPIINLLSIICHDNDPIVGLWTVAKWKYLMEVRGSYQDSGYDVNGSLSVLYRYPNEDRWRALMSLTYTKRKERKKSPKAPDILHKINIQVDKLRGHFFWATYDVDLKKNGDHFIGTSTMKFREPERYINSTGYFSMLQIDEMGRLTGEFYNNVSKSKGKVIFHQRRKWNEVVEKS